MLLLLLLEQSFSLWSLEEKKIQRRIVFEAPNPGMADL